MKRKNGKRREKVEGKRGNIQKEKNERIKGGGKDKKEGKKG